MSAYKQEIKDRFKNIEELSGQKGMYRTLDSAVDELIDRLNDLIEANPDLAEKEKALQAINGLLSSKDEDIAKVKIAEDECRGKGATINKERLYFRQLNAAIDAIKSNISYFLD